MTIENLIEAIEYCDNGNLDFNLKIKRAFLFNCKWYPLRATINLARRLANQKDDLTTNLAQIELSNLIFWVRISNVYFKECLPVPLNNEEKLQEIKRLSKLIQDLT
jgi:hypothetical protein